MAIAVDCVLRIRAGGGPKGESPFWAADEKRLYWVDIDGRTLHRFDPASGRDEACDVGERVGCAARDDANGFVLGLEGGVAHIDAFRAGGQVTPRRLHVPEPDRSGNRLNDGRCDFHGRFWVGSQLDPPDPQRRTASLYCIDGDRCTRIVDGLHVSNGVAFTADRRRMYHSDSYLTSKTIWTCALDPDDGRMLDRRVFAVSQAGRPDGGCCDADGCYWSCEIDGGRVVRYTPDGRIDRVIEMPVRWPTMCAFGGDALDVLYITSLRRGGAQAEHPDQPLAGSVFACRPGVTGVEEPRYRLGGAGLPAPVEATRVA